MSLHTPYFFLKETETGMRVCHNCDGAIKFMVTDNIDEKTSHLITMAIEQGKRLKAHEIASALLLVK